MSFFWHFGFGWSLSFLAHISLPLPLFLNKGLIKEINEARVKLIEVCLRQLRYDLSWSNQPDFVPNEVVFFMMLFTQTAKWSIWSSFIYMYIILFGRRICNWNSKCRELDPCRLNDQLKLLHLFQAHILEIPSASRLFRLQKNILVLVWNFQLNQRDKETLDFFFIIIRTCEI